MYLRPEVIASSAYAYVLMAACRRFCNTEGGYVSLPHLEAQSSLNEKGDQCSNEIAPLARPDVVFAPIGSCSNRSVSFASDQVGPAATYQSALCQTKGTTRAVGPCCAQHMLWQDSRGHSCLHVLWLFPWLISFSAQDMTRQCYMIDSFTGTTDSQVVDVCKTQLQT